MQTGNFCRMVSRFLRLSLYNSEGGASVLRPKPIEVKPLENYLLLISFNNGEDKIFDVKPMISGSWFGELKDRSIFNTVKISGNTVEWVNGQDICPDDLYYLSVPK